MVGYKIVDLDGITGKMQKYIHGLLWNGQASYLTYVKTISLADNWKNAIIILLCKLKTGRSPCKNYRGISLMLEKMSERILIERVQEAIKSKI